MQNAVAAHRFLGRIKPHPTPTCTRRPRFARRRFICRSIRSFAVLSALSLVHASYDSWDQDQLLRRCFARSLLQFLRDRPVDQPPETLQSRYGIIPLGRVEAPPAWQALSRDVMSKGREGLLTHLSPDLLPHPPPPSGTPRCLLAGTEQVRLFLGSELPAFIAHVFQAAAAATQQHPDLHPVHLSQYDLFHAHIFMPWPASRPHCPTTSTAAVEGTWQAQGLEQLEVCGTARGTSSTGGTASSTSSKQGSHADLAAEWQALELSLGVARPATASSSSSSSSSTSSIKFYHDEVSAAAGSTTSSTTSSWKDCVSFSSIHTPGSSSSTTTTTTTSTATTTATAGTDQDIPASAASAPDHAPGPAAASGPAAAPLALLLHAREYPAYDPDRFPYALGFCQHNSTLLHHPRAMDLRNMLWLEGQLYALDLAEASLLHSTLVWTGMEPLRTVYESDLGTPVADVTYLPWLKDDGSSGCSSKSSNGFSSKSSSRSSHGNGSHRQHDQNQHIIHQQQQQGGTKGPGSTVNSSEGGPAGDITQVRGSPGSHVFVVVR